MLRVGLTGGYASGKTFVSHRLQLLGCKAIHADILGHQVLSPGGEAYAPTIELFGQQILNAERTIDRKALASVVFESKERLEQLNSIVHPAVFALEEAAIRMYFDENPRVIVVLEAAILIETGRYKNCDRLIVTSCHLETQISRGIQRDRITRNEALARIARQLPNAERLRVADYVIDTECSTDETAEQVDKVFIQLRQLAEAC